MEDDLVRNRMKLMVVFIILARLSKGAEGVEDEK